MVRRWLIRFAYWLLDVLDAPLPEPEVEIQVLVAPPPEIEPYLAEARAQALAVESAPQSGEWKRHQVYAALLKHYPQAPKRALALAIEWALRLPQETPA